MTTSLLAVCGLSPQVITETVYALIDQGRSPDKVRVITTRQGRDACLSQLFDGGEGAWHRLLKDRNIPPATIDFSPQRVQVVTDDAGRAIDDILSEADSEQFLRACMTLAWTLSRHPADRLFYSIAGGRKTMGACLSFAAQAYGRPQDRVFHVLVTPEFESNRGFFFPPRIPVDAQLQDARGEAFCKSTRFAQIQLVAVPFFSFREQLSPTLLDQPQSPATLMASLVREEPGRLIIDLQRRVLEWKQQQVDVRPVQLALYALLAEIKKDSVCEHSGCRECQQCWLSQHDLLQQQQRLSRLYHSLAPQREAAEMSSSGIYGLTPDNFHSYRSKLNRTIEQGFGVIDAPEIQIASVGTRPGVRYGLRLEKTRIVIVR